MNNQDHNLAKEFNFSNQIEKIQIFLNLGSNNYQSPNSPALHEQYHQIIQQHANKMVLEQIQPRIIQIEERQDSNEQFFENQLKEQGDQIIQDEAQQIVVNEEMIKREENGQDYEVLNKESMKESNKQSNKQSKKKPRKKSKKDQSEEQYYSNEVLYRQKKQKQRNKKKMSKKQGAGQRDRKPRSSNQSGSSVVKQQNIIHINQSQALIKQQFKQKDRRISSLKLQQSLNCTFFQGWIDNEEGNADYESEYASLCQQSINQRHEHLITAKIKHLINEGQQNIIMNIHQLNPIYYTRK